MGGKCNGPVLHMQKTKKVERMKRKKETEQAEREGLEPPPKRIPKV